MYNRAPIDVKKGNGETMDQELKEQDIRKLLFMNLVMMFGSAAMQQMGKLVNPATGKTEVDLDGAQASIDMLEMIAARTQGNLDADEDRLLKQTLSTLQMNYVETAAAQPADAGQPGRDETDKTPSTPEDPAQGSPEDPKEDPKESKFRKSYG